MRHRERVIHSTNAHCYLEKWYEDYRYNPSTYGEAVLLNADYVRSEKTEVMDDVVTPSWLKLCKSGGIANNPMKQVSHTIIDNPVDTYIVSKGDQRSGSSPNWVWGEKSAYSAVGSSPSSNVVAARGGLLSLPTYDQSHYMALALEKAWSSVGLTEVQALVMIGESRKTVISMVSIFRRLIRILKSIKRLDTHALLHEITGKALSDRYMELRYAIRPLMYDFNGVIAAFKHETGETSKRLTFRGHEYFTDEVDSIASFTNGNGICGGVRGFDIERRSTVSFDVRAGVLTQLENASALAIWGLTQPIESAWELVPFSFIVDWFVNVGNTIAAWTPNYGLKTLASWTVTREIAIKEFRLTNTYANLGPSEVDFKPTSHQNQLGNCFYSDTTITTERIPDPSRRIIPTLNVNLDVFKLIDLLVIIKYLTGR